MSGKKYTLKLHGPQVKKAMQGIAIAALRDGGYAILNDSNTLVPHDTGILEATGDITLDKDKLRVYIHYDGPYAIKQHEDMTLRHPNGRKPKYLEKPLLDRGPDILDYVANKMKAEF